MYISNLFTKGTYGLRQVERPRINACSEVIRHGTEQLVFGPRRHLIDMSHQNDVSGTGPELFFYVAVASRSFSFREPRLESWDLGTLGRAPGPSITRNPLFGRGEACGATFLFPRENNSIFP